MGKQFESAHPGVKVVFSYGPSSGLAEQINQGAPADVFASASTTNMDQVVSAGAASNPTAFARNFMEIAAPPSNPGEVESVNDLANKGVKVALCQAARPVRGHRGAGVQQREDLGQAGHRGAGREVGAREGRAR